MTSNPEPELIEFRTISGTGSVRIPADKKEGRKYWLALDILRPPKVDYVNKKFPIDKGNYANILFLDAKKRVLREETLEYPAQVWTFTADIIGQILYSVECGFEVTQKNLRTVAQALGAVAVLSPFEPVSKLEIDTATIAIKCRDGCAIYARLYYQEYSLCPDQDKSPQPPPDIPEPPPPLEPGEPLDGDDGRPFLSDPYDIEGGDPFYEPFPDDQTPPPEPERTCQVVAFGNARIQGITTSGNPFNVVVQTFGVYGNAGSGVILKGDNKAYVRAYGSTFVTTQCSQEPIDSLIIQAPGNYIIESVTFL